MCKSHELINFHPWSLSYVILDLTIGFYISKSSPGTSPLSENQHVIEKLNVEALDIFFVFCSQNLYLSRIHLPGGCCTASWAVGTAPGGQYDVFAVYFVKL